MVKMKVGWGPEDRRKELREERKIVTCWEKKVAYEWRDQYGKEKEKYYNRNGWGIEAIEEFNREDRNYEKRWTD